MNLKKFLPLALVAGVLSLSSCKKDSDTASSENYLKLKVNGSWVTWNKVNSELGKDLLDATKTNFTLMGSDDAVNTVFDISVQVDGSNLGSGTYSSDNYYLPVTYTTNATSTNFKSYSNSGYIEGKPEPKYTLTITSVSSTSVSGKFTGNLLIEDFDNSFVEITEGEFVAPRIR